MGCIWIPCSLRFGAGTLNYGLGGENGVTVNVPMSQLFAYKGYERWEFSDESGGCDFDFVPFPNPQGGILGKSFLRSAYVIYGMDNNLSAVGQAVLNKLDTSNIIAMPASETTIPGVARTGTASVVNNFYVEASGSEYVSSVHFIAQTVRVVIQAGRRLYGRSSTY